jgi:hypothetical protein
MKRVLKKWKKVLGVFLVAKGVGFGFLTYKGMTGFAIANEVMGISAGFIVGLALMLCGIGLFMSKEKIHSFEKYFID